eukprot:536516_1
MSNTLLALSLKEELALIQIFIWHTRRHENKLRRKLRSIESKMEESRNQLRDVLKFMKAHQNGIDIHLKKLSKTETTLRKQIDNTLNKSNNNSNNNNIYNNNNNNSSYSSNNGKKKQTTQTKRAKKLNNDLINIVINRTDDQSQIIHLNYTFKLISLLLNDETKPIPNNYINYNNYNNLEIDYNISNNISEYIYYRQEICKIRNELVECVEKREFANQTQYNTQLLLNKYCKCKCKCNELIINDSDNENENDNNIENNFKKININILKNELIELGQYIYQKSGLIKQQKRDNITYLRVFIGSELITWIVKSNIVNIRYNALILCYLLIKYEYIYCAYKCNKTKINGKINTKINKCNYCIKTHLYFNDNNDLYRFRCDDSRIERISKMGWLQKISKFRSKRRHYIWDGVTKQLREYKNKGDTNAIHKYTFNNYIYLNECLDNKIFEIIFNDNKILKLKAISKREKDSWLRVLKKK